MNPESSEAPAEDTLVPADFLTSPVTEADIHVDPIELMNAKADTIQEQINQLTLICVSTNEQIAWLNNALAPILAMASQIGQAPGLKAQVARKALGL